jgi:hypothetical protein
MTDAIPRHMRFESGRRFAAAKCPQNDQEVSKMTLDRAEIQEALWAVGEQYGLTLSVQQQVSVAREIEANGVSRRLVIDALQDVGVAAPAGSAQSVAVVLGNKR